MESSQVIDLPIRDQRALQPLSLTFVCGKCTRTATWTGTLGSDLAARAKADGWDVRNGVEICKRCPK